MKINLNSIVSLYLLILFTSFGCKSQENCNEFYEKFVEAKFNANDKAALDFIDEAIKCDSENDDFKYEKAKLLIEGKNLAEALSVAKSMNLEPVSQLLQGVLQLKLENKDSRKNLEDAYKILKNTSNQDNESNFNRDSNIIQLSYLIDGKDKALNLLSKYRNTYSEEHQKKILDYFGNLIQENSPEEFLFKIYNLTEE